jgi:uncharacterized protein
MNLFSRFKTHLPTAHDLQRHRWMRPFAHRLSERTLWHPKTEAVARGAAVGVFWAFALPIAQIVLAAAHCIFWRANIPVAVALTFVTNPFTIGGWLWLAYQLGSHLLGTGTVLHTGWLKTVGWPTMVGMAIFALVGAFASYLLVHAGSRLWLVWRRARRARQRNVSRAL